MMNKKLKYAGVAALLMLGIGGWMVHRSRTQIEFKTVKADRGDVRATISATGNSNAVVTVQVGAQVSGNIKALYADFNTKVKKGQLVALIDPQIFQARVDQTRASLDSANASVASAQAGVQKAEADIASAQAALATQKANLLKAGSAVQDAKIKYDRRMELVKEGVMSQEDGETAKATYDQAVAERDAAQAQVDAAQHSIQAAQANKQVALTQLNSTRSQVAQAKAGLEQAELDLAHTQITAPVDGTVVARHMDVGQTVAASFSAPTIFEIAQDLTQMQVDTNVDEADIGKVQMGQPVIFTVDAYPNQRFKGTVAQIRKAPINVQNVITYDVVVSVHNPDLKLFPGMTANVKMLVDTASGVLRIPNAALRYRPNEALLKGSDTVQAASRGNQQQTTTIWVLGLDGKPRAAHVQLGITDGNFTAVSGGDLKEGDQIILSDATGKTASKTAAPASPMGGGGGRRGPGF